MASIALSFAACAPAEPPGEPASSSHRNERVEVGLPSRADQPATLIDRASGVGIAVINRDASGTSALQADEGNRYPQALGAGSLLELRARSDGFEDIVHFTAAPAQARIRYNISLVAVAGLRFVGGALELLDRQGAPRIRMAPPFAVDARGQRFRLAVELDGCDADRSPAAPWGRPTTPAGADMCELSVDLQPLALDAVYPVAVDPIWTTTAAMTEPRAQPQAALLGSGRVLVVGSDPGALVDAELFDSGSGTFAVTGSMLEPRALPRMARVNGGTRILVTGGTAPCAGCPALASAELFDEATGTFTSAGAMSTARIEHAVDTLSDGRVLVVGGNTALPGAPHLGSSDLFDPQTSAWSPGPQLATPRSEHTLTALADGSAIVAGGAPGPQTTERFDAVTNSFVPAGKLNQRRLSHGAVRLGDGRVLIAGGIAPASIDPVLLAELFDPSAPPESAWSAAGELSEPHYGGALSLVAGERALLSGGCCASSVSELFDPEAVLWKTTASLELARSTHAALQISPGVVLALGGSSDAGPTASAELYTLSPLGEPCAEDLECESGVCADGVCCNTTCFGACQACSAALKGSGTDGECGFVQAATIDPRGVCIASSGECGDTGRCQADGACERVAEGTACGSEQCATGSGQCEDGVCQCSLPECEADGHTLGETDCSPYTCREGACLSECRSSSECADDFLCNSDGRCTSPPLPPPTLGCACALEPRSSRWRWPTLALFGMAWLRRRQRRGVS